MLVESQILCDLLSGEMSIRDVETMQLGRAGKIVGDVEEKYSGACPDVGDFERWS